MLLSTYVLAVLSPLGIERNFYVAFVGIKMTKTMLLSTYVLAVLSPLGIERNFYVAFVGIKMKILWLLSQENSVFSKSHSS